MAELRLAGACTLEEANQVLAEFLPRFNQRFGVPATQPELAVEGVDSMKEYTDGNRVVQIYPLTNPHVRDMLALYLPRERITLTADLVTGSFDPSNIEDRARAYYAFVKQEGLNVTALCEFTVRRFHTGSSRR